MPLSAYLELFNWNGLLIINWSFRGRIKFLSAPSFTSGTCMDITVIMSPDGLLALSVWHQNGVRRCLTCAFGLRRSHDHNAPIG